MGEKAPLGAKRTPLLTGGAPYPLKRAPSWAKRGVLVPEGLFAVGRASYLLKKPQSCAKRALFVPEGRLCWRKGRRLNLESAIIGQKALFRGRRAPLLEGGAPYLLRATLWAKGASFRIRRATLLAGMHPYNSFGVKIRRWLRYSVNGDEYWRPCAFSAGVRIFLSRRSFHLISCAKGAPAPKTQGRQFPLGRGCQSLTPPPPWIRHWYSPRYLEDWYSLDRADILESQPFYSPRAASP